jgi:hypothetical protein
MSKYNSRKTTVDGFTFDSKKESKTLFRTKADGKRRINS